MDRRTIVLRADGGPNIGIGHLMRMRALGQALIDAQVDVRFAYQGAPETLLAQLVNDGLRPICCDDLGAVLHDLKPDAVVFDGYDFVQDDFETAQRHGAKAIIMDDLGLFDEAPGDVLINQNPGWHASDYRKFKGRLCLGLDFALLRREFYSAARPERKLQQSVKNILISGGGGDHKRVGLSCLEALERINDNQLNLMILSGPANESKEELYRLATLSSFNTTIVENITDMVTALSWADLGIFAAGSSLWECAWSALPTLALITADNQLKGAQAMAAAGATVAMDWRQGGSASELLQAVALMTENKAMRSSLSENARSLVDGQGAKRVCDVILNTCIQR